MSRLVPSVVIVTRPAHAGQRLFDRIVQHGHDAVWWPAFDIGAAPDAAAARAALARLAEYQLAIFVSANAVSASRALMLTPWPATTMIGAVGRSTREAIEVELQPPTGSVIAPLDEDEAGSEAFWRTWQVSADRMQPVRRVLVLRAEEGRNWLSERFSEMGAEVDSVAVYARRARHLSADDQARMQRCASAGTQALTIFTSSEAVAALDSQVGTVGAAWLRAGIAIACHPRIADQLVSSGYARMLNATFDDDSVIAKLESIRSS